jgi:hypothetical protein
MAVEGVSFSDIDQIGLRFVQSCLTV